MVEALDHKADITVEQIGEKTFRIKCNDCDWMETGGSKNVASRKRNKHAEEHRTSTHGAPEVPTIMDELAGVVHLPEVKDPPDPVVTAEYFKEGQMMHVEDPPDLEAEILAFNRKAKDEPCAWDCPIEHEHVGTAGIYGYKNHPPIRNDAPDSWVVHDVKIGTALNDAEAGDVVAIALDPFARGFDLPKTRVDLTKARLELQKGASDRDRAAWMAARAESVSATAVAKLAKGGDIDFTIQELIKEKVHGDSFTGNAYTEWGKEREPYLEEVGSRLYGLAGESHLFFARPNPRHSASPDALAIHPETGQVALGEYKTCGKELTIAEVHAKGYYDQIQWQLYVLEATHCWLIWEWRHTTDWGFEPEPGGRHLIVRDETRIELLKTYADKYLAALDAYRANPVVQDVDPSLNEAITDLLYYRDMVKECEEAVRGNLERLGIKSVELPSARVSYVLGSGRSSLDKEALEKDHPGLLEKYTKVGKAPEKPTLRITPRGEKESE